MVGLDHGSAEPGEDSDPLTDARNMRYGLMLFAVYLAIYGGYVLVNVFAPDLMEKTIAGVTVAILSGFGLILAAFLLALVYGWLCREPQSSLPKKDQPE